MEKEVKNLKSILTENHPSKSNEECLLPEQLKPSEWKEIRLFFSSSFVDTQAERDVVIKKVVPDLNQKLKESCIRIVPVDLRWGVLKEQSKDCYAIQKTCLTEIDNCRTIKSTYPYFIGIRTQRYGWVQTEFLKSSEYENPELYSWIKVLEQYRKELSITSLECIHAVWPMEKTQSTPTIFFYKREIKNPEDIEGDMKWVFDFEHQALNAMLDESVENQYNRTDKALIYKNDKKDLDDYLQTLDHVKYRKYPCSYRRGGARITGSTKNKKFGIGYVEGLESFEKNVKTDLLNAIQKNFKAADMSAFPAHKLKNIPYEQAMEEKASTFVGRHGHLEKIFTHCITEKVGHSVMVVKGKPGRGKSALMSYVAIKCRNQLGSNNNFVFMQGVDTCPHSSNLEQMLLRLHENICIHVGTKNTLLSTEDLRTKHVSQLEDIASNNPEKMFIIFVDAVNQLHEEMQALNMWWLPSENSPNNLRFIISTLIKENKTYENALTRCPGAEILSVKNMTKNEGKQMVSSLLAKFNKKLTTDDEDKFLKNQMALLIGKNTSPLYLSAACEALRTQGVYEKMTRYIEDLPKTVPELFHFLLEKWSEDYGEQFIRYLTCIIRLSRDGLLENVISRTLSYIEKRNHLSFECSFSVFYSVVRGFLSSGGGGNLRFFHDQLNQVVTMKYLTPEFEAEIHDILAGFYLRNIQPQLCEEPTSKPPLYYEEFLRHCVYHQVLARKKNKETVDFFRTLQNIFFIREKVKTDQGSSLRKDYFQALKYERNEVTRRSLQQWQKFVSIYEPFIKQSPDWSLNFALNQIRSNYVYIDTLNLNINVTPCDEYPTYWVNKPPIDTDSVLLRYNTDRYEYCAATTVQGNMVAVGEWYSSDLLSVYDMSTGELLHQIKDYSIKSLTFTNDHTHLWFGDREGFVLAFDLSIAKVVWKSEREIGKGKVIWLQHIGEHMVCGTDGGTVAFIDPTSKLTTNTWNTGEECQLYCYNHHKQQILCGDESSLKCWSVSGDLVRIVLKGNVIVHGLDIHPTNGDVVLCKMCEFDESKHKVCQLNMMSGELMWEVKGVSWDCNKILYTPSGENSVCVSEDEKTLLLLNSKGNITNHMIGYPYRTDDIRMIPGTNHLLVTGMKGSYLFNLPTTTEQQVGNEKPYRILAVTSLNNTEEFIILKAESEWKCVVERCSSETFEVIESVDIEGEMTDLSSIVAHPLRDIVVVSTYDDLLFLNSTTLCTVVKHKVVDGIRDLTISSDGSKILVVKWESCTSVLYDITDLNNITILTTFKIKDRMESSDIHNDGRMVVCGGKDGVVLYDVSTAQQIKTLKKNWEFECTYLVRFRYKPECVLYNIEGGVYTMTLDGVVLQKYSGKHYYQSSIHLNNSFLVTGNKDTSIHIHDIATGETVYKFFHQSSEGFKCFAYQPRYNTLIAGNNNGKLYLLKSMEPVHLANTKSE